jgi:P-type Cu2+ transporter
MTVSGGNLCRHCLLPVGVRALRQTVNGESCAFCCYGCSIAFQVKNGKTEEWEAAWLLIRLGIGGFLSMNIMLFSLLIYGGVFTGADARMLPIIDILLLILATPTVIILGGPFLRETLVEGIRGRLTSSALIVLGVGSAYIYSAVAVVERNAQVYFDTATMVLMLFTLGRYLEAAGRARAARDLEPLLAAERENVVVVQNGTEVSRPVREIEAGMLVRVRPGERIAVDGVIVEGASHADEAVITGESRPVEKDIGSAVIAGSINMEGLLLIRSNGGGTATRWAQICRSVRDALTRRSPIERVADRAVAIAVPGVLVLGVATVTYWAQWLPFDRALLMGVAVLVVACPCAVGLAAPLATSLGIGRLARHGCLVRDAGALEALARVRLLAFDKTGTLTLGKARVVAIDTEGVAAAEVLALAAGLERHSEHGLGRAVRNAAAERGVESVLARNVRAVPGRGIVGHVNGGRVAAGNLALMRDLTFPVTAGRADCGCRAEASGHSVIYVGWDERTRAVISLDDAPVAEAQAMIAALRARGLRVTVLTGDLAPAAQRVAAALGIEDVRAGLTPDEKREALDRHRGSREQAVAMVGDGLNDGPVLVEADVGIAVGTATDLARETASVVLPVGGLWLLPWIIDTARAVGSTVRANLLWAFGYNLVALSLAALGMLQPVIAAAVMAGSSILVVLNSLRLERLPGPAPIAASEAATGRGERSPPGRLEALGAASERAERPLVTRTHRG